jgi:ribosomal protein S18 acetylase RimI-like enzyme
LTPGDGEALVSTVSMWLARAFTSLRRHGLWATVRTAWKRRRPSRLRLVLFGLTQPAAPSSAHADRFTFRFALPEEATALAGMDAAEATLALAAGDRCLLQLDERQRLVGYAWVAVAPVVFLTDGLHLALPADTAYVYKTYTLPEYRGAGLQPLRTLELLRRVEAEGRRRLLCFVKDTNLESLRGVRKAGYEPVGDVRFSFLRDHVRTDVRLAREWWSERRRV